MSRGVGKEGEKGRRGALGQQEAGGLRDCGKKEETWRFLVVVGISLERRSINKYILRGRLEGGGEGVARRGGWAYFFFTNFHKEKKAENRG